MLRLAFPFFHLLGIDAYKTPYCMPNGIDIHENDLHQHAPAVLEELLKDHTTGRNIIWATHDYEGLGKGYGYRDEIRPELITGEHSRVIRPRVLKSKEEQTGRVRGMAEVFTPAWVVKKMVDAVEIDVGTRCLEITCGEAPFLVSRYDATTGNPIPRSKRVGVLDRKMEKVDRWRSVPKRWLDRVRLAYQTTYGYEWQGDSLLLARKNMFDTFIDHYRACFDRMPDEGLLKEFAEIVSWNLWQMDGLSYQPPREKTVDPSMAQISMFEEVCEEVPVEYAAPFCQIRDWQKNETTEVIRIKNQDTMKFDVIIGNPPYQEEVDGDNKQFASPVYNLFIDESQKIAERLELIHPARFLFNAGATPKNWNSKMLKDEHFKILNYFGNSMDVFPNANINGGVVISYWENGKKYKPIGSFTPFDSLVTIRDKVLDSGFQSFSEIVYPRDLYRFEEIVYEENPCIEGRQSKGHRYDVGSNIMELLEEIFKDEKPQDNSDYSRLLGRYKNERTYKWIEKKYLKVPDNYDFYKVVIAKADGAAGQIGKPIPAQICGRPIIGLPSDSQTASFISIGKFEKECDAEFCKKYIQTQFARTLLGVLKVTQSLTKDVWTYVPLQDFTANSDIDWSKSVAEIDEQLFDKYGLDEKEREFIRTKVKEMK